MEFSKLDFFEIVLIIGLYLDSTGNGWYLRVHLLYIGLFII